VRGEWGGVAALVGVVLAGCAPAAGPPPAAPPPTAQAATPAPDPVTVCANQLTYWAGEELHGAPDAGFDYQEMGLTHAQFDALDALVAQARAQGLPPDRLAARARELCTAIVAEPRSTGGGWP
jgi:hypothetical protein